MATTQSDADRQINNLMEFLFLEAQEKAEEIRQKANAEYESQFQEMKREVEYVISSSAHLRLHARAATRTQTSCS
jgi:vacuolar-type H+-ATPase subunit E/Vma4